MKLLVRIVLPLFCFLHTMAFSQKTATPEIKEVKSAIDFENNLSWKQILDKAKKERKYIFLDCFTTWCGPCKRLEKEVYTVDSVGAFLNKNFISVKMQMDRKKTDSELVKARYEDARFLETKYNIDGYPTLIFFNTEGEVVTKEAGYYAPEKFLNIARVSLNPGRVYNDPVVALDKSIDTYRKTGSDVNELIPIIKEAKAINKKKIVDSLSNIYFTYLRNNPHSIVYKKEILLFIGNSALEDNDPILNVFYPNGGKVDAIVGEGFSRFAIDKYIKKTYFERTNFFKKEIPNASWDSMHGVIVKRFNEDFASRAVLAAKAEWYKRNQDESLFPKYILLLVESYGLKSVLPYSYLLGEVSQYEDAKRMSAFVVNGTCWQFVFLSPKNNDLLDMGIRCMKMVVDEGERDSTAWWNSQTFDTYANLLYKKGRVKDAIEYEQKALTLLKAEPDVPKDMIISYEEALKKMKLGVPTWPDVNGKG